MSVDSSIDGDVEYMDDVNTLSPELSAVQDLMDFSRHVLSLSAAHCSEFSDVSGSSTPIRDPDQNTKILFNSTSTAINRELKKKKNRKFIPGKHTTVAKNDLRRGYAQAYVDALNSGSLPVFKKSLLDFCMPDCVIITRNVSSSGMIFPSYVETLGVNAVTLLYEALIKSSPDVAFELHSSTIRVYADGTSAVVGKFTMIATKVFALAGLQENGDHKVVLSLDPVEELTQKFGKAQLTARITSIVDDPVTGVQTEVENETKVAIGAVKKDKVKISVIGTFHMYLNSTEKKAYRIVFSQWNDDDKQESSEGFAGVLRNSGYTDMINGGSKEKSVVQT